MSFTNQYERYIRDCNNGNSTKINPIYPQKVIFILYNHELKYEQLNEIERNRKQ